MSWLRSAITKAAEVGGKNIGPNLSRTVRNVAQQAGHAVAGGAKLVQDRLVGRNLNNSRVAIKRLNEVALNARGSERVQALTRWLGALKEIGKETKPAWIVEEPHNGGSEEIQVPSSQDDLSSPRKISKVLFYDFEGDGEPMNFREIFLRSRAIENIVLSMILEAPADEEVSLLLDIFGLCLTGGKELHIAIISSIQDLAKAFSNYPEDIMGKREDLLGYAQNAIGDLKLNAEFERLEVDITTLMQLTHEKQGRVAVKEDGLNKTKELIQLDIQLRNLLQRKATVISQAVNGQAARTEKVEQLRNLSKSLEQAVMVAEQQISENRNQKEEALKYRVTKAQEVSELEKAVAAEVKVLEQKRSELEAQLKEVKASLVAAMNRHINIQEEKEQFDEASTKLVAHLAIQEEDLTRSVVSHRAEVSVLGTWISFLEDTWQLKASCTQQHDKNIWDALNGLKEQFFHTIVTNLSYHHEELCVLLKQLESCFNELKDMEEQRKVAEVEEEGSAADRSKQKIQEKYLDIEGQVINIFRTVELLKDEVQSFASLASGDTIELDKSVMDAFDSIAQKQKEFEAMQRPDLEIVDFPIKTPKAKPSLQWADPVEQPGYEELPPDANFDDETFLSEIANTADNGGSEKFNEVHNVSKEDTEGWEFDEFEEELKRDLES